LKKNKVVKAMLREASSRSAYAILSSRLLKSIAGKKKSGKTRRGNNYLRDRDEKLKRAEAELSAYRAKLAKGNYREMEKVVSKVKAIVKGVSTIVIICEYLFYCDFRTAKLTRCLLRIVANNNLPLFPV